MSSKKPKKHDGHSKRHRNSSSSDENGRKPDKKKHKDTNDISYQMGSLSMDYSRHSLYDSPFNDYSERTHWQDNFERPPPLSPVLSDSQSRQHGPLYSPIARPNHSSPSPWRLAPASRPHPQRRRSIHEPLNPRRSSFLPPSTSSHHAPTFIGLQGSVNPGTGSPLVWMNDVQTSRNLRKSYSPPEIIAPRPTRPVKVNMIYESPQSGSSISPPVHRPASARADYVPRDRLGSPVIPWSRERGCSSAMGRISGGHGDPSYSGAGYTRVHDPPPSPAGYSSPSHLSSPVLPRKLQRKHNLTRK